MTEDDVVIRPPIEEDLESIANLIEEIEKYYGATEIDSVELRQAQTGRALFGESRFAWALLCLERQSGTLVGFASWSFIWPAASATHTMFVKELFVTEPWRRKGLGGRLFQELQDIAEAREDCGRLEWTADRNNPSAIDFYARHGFSPDEGKIYYRWAIAEQ